jgi:ankyrin repeat protein
MSNKKLIRYCKKGDLKAVENEIKLGANDLEYGLLIACHSDHTDIVELMLKLGAKDYYQALLYTCLGGYINIIELTIKLGANDFNRGLSVLYSENNIDIDTLMIKCEATNVSKFYDYKSKPFEVIKILEAGLNTKYINKIKGYNLLVTDLDGFKQETKTALNEYLLDPIIKIIQSYSVL